MTDRHPARELLERFMRDAAGPAERRRVVRHLLRGCRPCTAMTRTLWELAGKPVLETAEISETAAEAGGVLHPASYEGVFERLLAACRGREVEIASLGREAAGVALDLALLAARQGRWGKVERLAGDLAPLLAGRDVGEGTLAALLVLRRAVETESASIGLLAELAGYLRNRRRRLL
jgi:hypothetical protein